MMKINVNWGNAQRTVIFFHIYAGWEWPDFYMGVDELCAMMGRQTIDLVVFFHEDNPQWPPDAAANLRRIAERDVEQVRSIMVVGANEVVRSMVNLLRRTNSRLTIHSKLRFVGGIEDIRDLIEQERHV